MQFYNFKRTVSSTVLKKYKFVTVVNFQFSTFKSEMVMKSMQMKQFISRIKLHRSSL